MERILIFGANSFLAKAFMQLYGEKFEMVPVFRKQMNGQHHLDFENDDAETWTSCLTGTFDGILFFQGLNPTVGVQDLNANHFRRMLMVNLVTPSLLIRNLADRINDQGLILFFSSIAKRKGSYDIAYSSAKAGLTGLMHSFSNAYPRLRFNMLSPGLIQDSPVYEGMSPDFRLKHIEKMVDRTLINAKDIAGVINNIIADKSIVRHDEEFDERFN